jgi:hypothetical protein
MKAISVLIVAPLVVITLAVIRTLFLLLGWWLAHDFFNIPMIGFWQAYGVCLVANVLIKNGNQQSK